MKPEEKTRYVESWERKCRFIDTYHQKIFKLHETVWEKGTLMTLFELNDKAICDGELMKTLNNLKDMLENKMEVEM